MPQASEDDRARARALFGSIMVDDACKFLLARGFKERRWTWQAPDREITDDEWFAINFLIDEWDYGGIENVGTL